MESNIKTKKLKLSTYFFYLITTTAFIFCFWNTFNWLHYKYSYVDSYYSHGYLIPFVSAYLIYLKKDQFIDTKIAGNISGLVLILVALTIHIIATMSDINFISGFAMFFYILGCLLYVWGFAVLRVMLFPVSFLLFMFPIPGQLIDTIGLPTKTVATAIGLKIVSLLGIPYYLEGFRINLAETTMFVGTPCNGMKSLISFLCLGLLAAYITNISMWKRIVIIAGIYPLAVFLNGCRITILVFIADKYGIEKASPESYLHDLSGILVFAVGLIILFGLIKFWTPKIKE